MNQVIEMYCGLQLNMCRRHRQRSKNVKSETLQCVIVGVNFCVNFLKYFNFSQVI